MPKIIPELRERFVAAARRRVLESEGHDVTIREVALDCQTAVGTVYNYFHSKEALLSAVMLEDWVVCREGMDAAAEGQSEPMASMRDLIAALRAFSARYAPTWRNYAGTRDSLEALNLRHAQIIKAISGPVGRILTRFDLCFDPNLPEVLSELALMASRTDDGFERIAPVLERILK